MAILVAGAILGPVLHRERAGQGCVMGVVFAHGGPMRGHIVTGMVLSHGRRGESRERAGGGEQDTHRNLSLICRVSFCPVSLPLTSGRTIPISLREGDYEWLSNRRSWRAGASGAPKR